MCANIITYVNGLFIDAGMCMEKGFAPVLQIVDINGIIRSNPFTWKSLKECVFLKQVEINCAAVKWLPNSTEKTWKSWVKNL